MAIDDVRFYRDCGLLPPPRRLRTRTDDFGFRIEHVERLRLIGRALGYGFSLEDVVDESRLVTVRDEQRSTRPVKFSVGHAFLGVSAHFILSGEAAEE
jgi:DNA-binding transcriptional MerR regulator